MSYPGIYNNGSGANPNYPLFNERVGNFLQNTNQDALNYINSIEGRAGSGPVRFGRITVVNPYPVVFWNSFNTTNVSYGRGRGDRDDDGAARVLMFIISAIVTGLALYKIGEWWNKSKDAKEELEDLNLFARTIKHDARAYPYNTDIQEIQNIIQVKQRIIDRISNSAQMNLALAVTVASAGAIAALGALAAAPELMALGAIVGLVAGGAALLKWSIEKFDKHPLRDAKILRAACQKLSEARSRGRGTALPMSDEVQRRANLLPVFRNAVPVQA